MKMNLRTLTQTSDLGLRFATQDVCARPSTFSPRDANQMMTVGIYQIDIDAKMKQLDVSAKTLDRDIQANVGDPVWREAWDGWYAHWKAYYAETQKLLNKLFSNPFRTKEIDDQVESYREQLLGWYTDYRRQRGRDGRTPVPPPSGQPPVKGEEPGKEGPAGLPWWFWMISGVAVVGVSYIVYRKVQEGRAKAAFIHKRAPGLLEKYLPGHGKEAYEYSQAGRDHDDPHAPHFSVGRDRDRPRRDTRYVHEDRDYVLAESDAAGRGSRSNYGYGYASDPDPRRDRDEMLYEEGPKRIPPARPRQDYDRNYARSEDDYRSPFSRDFDGNVDYDFEDDYP